MPYDPLPGRQVHGKIGIVQWLNGSQQKDYRTEDREIEPPGVAIAFTPRGSK
jgi:hypothetical protein